MALPTPFETKRKKAPIGALGRILYLNVAEGMGLKDNLLHLGQLIAGRIESQLSEMKSVC